MISLFKRIYKRLFKKNHVESFDKIITTKSVNELIDSLNPSWESVCNPPYEIKEIIKHFDLKYAGCDLKILIHLPSQLLSPGGNSVFLNIYETLKFMGVKTCLLNWDDESDIVFNTFKPNVFITSDDDLYLNRINWKYIKEYKNTNKLIIGLTASLEEYGNTPLNNRIEWAKKNFIDFYYSFRAEEYTSTRKEYSLFFSNGFKICNIEFGANLLKFYPIKNNKKKSLDFIFFGSTNYAKQKRYSNYFLPILKNKYTGMIWGPGWPWVKNVISLENQKYYYSCAKIGLNLHLEEQINWACELNERTYILAACKIPQLLDAPALLKYRFNEEMYFSAKNADEYFKLFNYMKENPNEVKKRTEKIYLEVINNHSTFNRMEKFISFLNNLSNE